MLKYFRLDFYFRQLLLNEAMSVAIMLNLVPNFSLFPEKNCWNIT